MSSLSDRSIYLSRAAAGLDTEPIDVITTATYHSMEVLNQFLYTGLVEAKGCVSRIANPDQDPGWDCLIVIDTKAVALRKRFMDLIPEIDALRGMMADLGSQLDEQASELDS
jgi:hypothetical protein